MLVKPGYPVTSVFYWIKFPPGGRNHTKIYNIKKNSLWIAGVNMVCNLCFIPITTQQTILQNLWIFSQRFPPIFSAWKLFIIFLSPSGTGYISPALVYILLLLLAGHQVILNLCSYLFISFLVVLNQRVMINKILKKLVSKVWHP